MFHKKKRQQYEKKAEFAALRGAIDDKNDEIKRLKDQIREMQTEADSAATNEDIAQIMRNKIANALKNLRLESGFTNCWIGGTAAPLTGSLSDVERMVVTYLAFINITRSA